MEKSKVYFTNLRAKAGLSLPDKLEKLVMKAGLSKIPFENKFTALKIHFGEPGNLAFIRHNYAKRIVDILKKQQAIVFATDSNTLYKGKRKHAVDHLNAAAENGFTPLSIGCNILIADGLLGNCYREIPIGLKHIKNAKIGSAIADADIIVSMNHFKGHELAGFGGAIKNLGMGSGSIAGKLEMHSHSKPFFKETACTGCAVCYKNCAYGAITFLPNEKKVAVDPDKCVGCGQCIAMCQFNAMRPSWNEFSNVMGEKMAEYAFAVLKEKHAFHINFLMNISPDCDCFSSNDYPIVPDIGIAASFDPVALDRASADMVNASPSLKGSILDEKMTGNHSETDKFKCIHGSTDWEATLKHAESIGIGKNAYELINLD